MKDNVKTLLLTSMTKGTHWCIVMSTDNVRQWSQHLKETYAYEQDASNAVWQCEGKQFAQP